MISSADQPLRCWLTMSDWRNTPQPIVRLGMAFAWNARSAVFLELHVVALGHALQKGAVARRALRVQAEVSDGPLSAGS